MSTLADLHGRFPRVGRVEWIGLRPARREAVLDVDRVAVAPSGLAGDRARKGKRAVTLIQAEHLPVIAALSGLQAVPPAILRRNLVVSGINLSALKGETVTVGDAVLRLTVACYPCSRMEEALGSGGYNAMRGHGGWCAEVVTPGPIAIGDPVRSGG